MMSCSSMMATSSTGRAWDARRYVAGVLDEVDQLVQPAHEERLAVGGREPDLALLRAALRGTLEGDQEQGAAGLLEEVPERRGRELEPHVGGVVQHLDHGVSPSLKVVLSPAADSLLTEIPSSAPTLTRGNNGRRLIPDRKSVV